MSMRRVLLLAALLLAIALSGGVGLVARTSLPRLVPVVVLVCALPGLVELWRRRDRTAVALLLVGVVIAPIVALAVNARVHRVVHVDNALGMPVQVWLDGKPLAVIAPSSPVDEPERVRIPFGRHRLGWTEVGAPFARHEIDADVAWIGEHLYSPGRAACYWLEVTAYGEGSTHELEHGPQPVRELHQFDRVDVWFGSTPKKVSAPFGIGGDTRVALQRYGLCMALAAAGCSPETRDEFVECQTTLHGPGESVDCFGDAKKRCGNEGVPVDPKVP
jgi:hypothetical protein